ncbi:hypothetical protein E2C01_062956 [Portunus trituberculatus]|uniref:Uncharacterized protein n=1 Tax=Portunus trituberculatus TaxID=210409 RepID=A0A5B7HIZ4_PORTR|nr:hypothetical protein [Portunus trituberculatus]
MWSGADALKLVWSGTGIFKRVWNGVGGFINWCGVVFKDYKWL